MSIGSIETRLYDGRVKKLTTYSFAVDPAKLERAFEKRNLTKKGAAKELGYSHSAFQNVFKEGVISNSMAKGLEHLYNITREEIAYIASEPEKEPEAPQAAQTCAGLTETQVYHAVKAAMWDALRERDDEKAQKAKTSNGDAQYVLLYRAMLDAMNQAFKINAKEIRGLIFAAAMNAVRMSLKKDMLNEG